MDSHLDVGGTVWWKLYLDLFLSAMSPVNVL